MDIYIQLPLAENVRMAIYIQQSLAKNVKMTIYSQRSVISWQSLKWIFAFY